MSRVSVLVVGAGPTGLVLACDLARRGISLRIIDKAPSFPTGSRAKGLQPRSLEVFDDLGLVDPIRAGGGSERVESSYLVGCDGGHSTVRKALGVPFDGETYGAELGVLGDVEVDGLSPDRWHMWSDSEDALLLCPLPGTRSWQFQASPWYDEQGRMPEPSHDVHTVLDYLDGH